MLKKNKHGFKLVSLLLVLAIIAVGCTPKNETGNSGNGGSDAAGKKEFRMNLSEQPPTLDPAQVQDQVSATVLNGIYEGLLRKDEKGNDVAGIAKDWKISDDGLTYTFNLRDDAKWSNGDPVTANDFVYAWKRVLDPDLKPAAAAYAYQLYYIKNAEKYNTGADGVTADDVAVKAVDEHTLEVTLNSPTPYFLSLMSFTTYFPVHQSVKDNEAWATDAKTIITNGSFKMTEWKKNTSITLVPNENYYAKDDVKLSKVFFTMVNDSGTELSMYQTDKLDYAGMPTGLIPTEQFETLKKSNPDEFKVKGTASIYYYMFNIKQEPFNNQKIRQALSMAISRQDITDKIALGGEKPAFGFVPPGIKGEKEDFRAEVSDAYFTEDIEAAKKLLAEGLQELGLSKMPTVKLAYNTNDKHQKIAEAIAAMWKTNLGVDTSIENQEWGVFIDNRNRLNYEVARGGNGADYNDPMTFIDLYTSKSGNNNTGFASKEYDDMVKKAYATDNQKERMQAMARAEQILIESRAVAPLFYYSSVYMIKPGYEGIFMDYKGDIDYNRGSYVGK
ncbi:peptide ABC transporter substrate-binding protein [Paenibacillus radicis (ex Gao et al. 2016)]|uniref:Oligopeptide-binding protein OppA n=1 Tax=Paenibacillus radicis (ex Gao et al. 2016) TaxID=1737354 RepID=A0A917HNI5_9BACL|nr:peptide ABC transporter substrate-binding protein [Paenibacillus radicis (ex Gao et al. 2016)]GGG85116.1 oligopeptide-binding protein OppA [Paenibacillus radicis (ex Gao et al. 2016)]